jgi:dipeptidyl aminopeptidase/acylaminoacyl peptidase
VTDLPLDVDNFRLSPQGDRLLFSMAVFRDCADLACTKARLDEQGKNKASGKVYDRLFVRHWDTWADGRNNVLYSAPIDASGKVSGPAGQPERHARWRCAIQAFRRPRRIPLQPGRQDGGLLGPHRRQDGSLVDQLRCLHGAGHRRRPRNLTADNQAWDSKAIYSPDGRMLAYLAMDKPTFEADRFHLVLIDVASGKKRTVADNWDRSIADFRWTRTARPSWPRPTTSASTACSPSTRPAARSRP